jgi:hypothetical protein
MAHFLPEHWLSVGWKLGSTEPEYSALQNTAGIPRRKHQSLDLQVNSNSFSSKDPKI